MKEIKIYSLKQFYQVIRDPSFDRKNSVALISSSYPVDENRLHGIQYVSCEYDDLDYQVLGRVMTDVHARKFARFVTSCDDSVSTFYCVCDGGCRRSSAVGAALYRFFNLEEVEMKIWMDPRFEPNVWVYRLMCDALGCPIGDNDLDIRIYANRTAIRNRIRGGQT